MLDSSLSADCLEIMNEEEAHESNIASYTCRGALRVMMSLLVPCNLFFMTFTILTIIIILVFSFFQLSYFSLTHAAAAIPFPAFRNCTDM